jgi:crotonobetainyl-CoA:carnitine CoA-transferase CaiB-like acyl-CoA transferase
VTSKWIASDTAWVPGRRAPLLNEDADVMRRARTAPRLPQPTAPPKRALEGVRVFDFSWFLASAGGTRFLAALGAEVIKVEFHTNPDTRMGAMAPVGGREARAAARAGATGPLRPETDPNMGGQFNNKNTGKRGISLNVRDPRGLEIAKRLIARSDIVAEGFSPGVLQRWGLGWDVLQTIKPDIIYAQQSGMGSHGTYGRFRSVGPVAAAFAGSAEMSGLPAPAMPAGWGYSYLDWLGAYSFSLAMLSALYHRDRTGRGQYIDASQCEAGLFSGGTAYLDHSANGRSSARTGNRSPYRPAAPHGAYPIAGSDRWIAIACFDESQWTALRRVSGRALDDPRFATLADRIAHQDDLDHAVAAWTRTREGRGLMAELQTSGVPAGVCQTAADRVELDPQLAHLEWLTEVTGTRIGTWPVAEVPVKMSATPACVAGPTNRGAPCYGEDNGYVYGELLGMTEHEIERLAADGVI